MSKSLRKLLIILLVILPAWSCKDKIEPMPEKGADVNIMVVFAPGQLGDRGYADSVMEGLSLLDASDKEYENNRLQLQFLSGFNVEDTRLNIRQWLENPVNPYYGNTYERRLLVLTEMYMVNWLGEFKSSILPTDEVLIIKANEEDVDKSAAFLGLGERVHGLNISAAENIRRFCDLIKWHNAEYPEALCQEVPILRVFNEETGSYRYRDDVNNTLKQELGDDIFVYNFCLVDEIGNEDDIMTTEKQTSVMEMAFEMGAFLEEIYEADGVSFAVVDLGSGNAGIDYFLLRLGDANGLNLLMLDATDAIGLNRYWINRRFDKALLMWGYSWIQNAVGAMPKMVVHSAKDGYSEDNFVYDE